MPSTFADAGRLTPPPHRRSTVDRRWLGIAIVAEVTVVFLAYMAINVPVDGPKLLPNEATQHWHAAVIGALVVALGAVLVVVTTLRARRASPDTAAAVDPAATTEMQLPRVPRSLRFERVPGRTVAFAGGLSMMTIVPSAVLGAPFWLAWLAFLSPWVPLVVVEARCKYARDALFTCFGLVVLLQLLHMVEHTVQVGQLVATMGDLSRSHGIIGKLDFELTHFVADTTLWLSLGLLTVAFRGGNRWLVVAFAAASFHEVEHLYLFWLHLSDNAFYLSGGFAGIMGRNGLIGSPLDRPYLHYAYNLIVFVPMLIAVWDDARRVDRLEGARAPVEREPAKALA